MTILNQEPFKLILFNLEGFLQIFSQTYSDFFKIIINALVGCGDDLNVLLSLKSYQESSCFNILRLQQKF